MLILDVQYGNIWTNIPADLFKQLRVRTGDLLHVRIFHNDTKMFDGTMPFAETFGAVSTGQPLAYLNSLLQLSFALNMGSFAAAHHIESGSDWNVEIEKKK